MTPDAQPWLNADELERALDQMRNTVAGVGDDEQRVRQVQALEQLANYAAMLRDSTAAGARSRTRRPFAFKLEFEDGRWNVDEKELEAAPHIGDIVSFAGRPWRVRTSQLVRPRPSAKPDREFFVCAPAA